MRKTIWWFVGGSVLLLGSLSGCSASDTSDTSGASGSSGSGSAGSAGSPSGGDCSSFTACGGDVTGTWKLTDYCQNASQKAASGSGFDDCPTATFSATPVSESGTVTYGAGIGQANAQVSFTATATIPSACLNGKTCADLQAAYMATPGETSAACSTVTAGCTCTLAFTTSSMQRETYTVSGSNITETDSDDGTPDTSQFCVSGNELKIYSDDGTIVLTR